MIRSMIQAAVLAAAAILLLGQPAPVEAQIYRWVDEQGVPHFSEGLDSIPEQSRKTATPFAPLAPSGPAAGGAPGAAGADEGMRATGWTPIRFTPGRPIIVEAQINGNTAAKLILDTGADRTVINPRVLAAAGASVTEGPGAQIRGATGTAPVRGVQLDVLAVGGAKVSKLLVISHDIEQEGVDGLLGRDFLDQFKVSINSERGFVFLGPK
jgi:predicted aspartyl protease